MCFVNCACETVEFCVYPSYFPFLKNFMSYGNLPESWTSTDYGVKTICTDHGMLATMDITAEPFSESKLFLTSLVVGVSLYMMTVNSSFVCLLLF